MLFTLLDSRLVDILLIGAAIYFIFPGVFKRKKVNRTNTSSHSERTTYTNAAPKKEDDGKGEYIDYEEIK